MHPKHDIGNMVNIQISFFLFYSIKKTNSKTYTIKKKKPKTENKNKPNK